MALLLEDNPNLEKEMGTDQRAFKVNATNQIVAVPSSWSDDKVEGMFQQQQDEQNSPNAKALADNPDVAAVLPKDYYGQNFESPLSDIPTKQKQWPDYVYEGIEGRARAFKANFDASLGVTQKGYSGELDKQAMAKYPGASLAGGLTEMVPAMMASMGLGEVLGIGKLATMAGKAVNVPFTPELAKKAMTALVSGALQGGLFGGLSETEKQVVSGENDFSKVGKSVLDNSLMFAGYSAGGLIPSRSIATAAIGGLTYAIGRAQGLPEPDNLLNTIAMMALHHVSTGGDPKESLDAIVQAGTAYIPSKNDIVNHNVAADVFDTHLADKAKEVLAKYQAKADELTAKVQAEAALPADSSLPKDLQPAPSTGIEVNVTPEMKTVYHATPTENVESINKNGVKSGMVSDTKADAEEYAQMLRNRGSKDVTVMELKVPKESLESRGVVETASGKRVGERFNVVQKSPLEIVASSPEMTKDLIKSIVEDASGVKEAKPVEAASSTRPEDFKTAEEYVASKTKEVQDLQDKASKLSKKKKLSVSELAEQTKAQNEYGRKAAELSQKGEAGLAAEWNAAQKPVSEGKAKEPWQMTKDEYIKYAVENKLIEKGTLSKSETSAMAKDIHWNVVDKAIREGKPVPSEVLAEYPELSGKAKEATSQNDVDALAYKLSKMIGQAVNAKMQAFAKGILEKDPAIVSEWVAHAKGHNENSKKLFEEATGVKLPSTIEGKRQAIYDWAGQEVPKPAEKAPEPPKMTKEESFKKMQEAKDNKTLDTNVRYDKGIMTRRAFVEDRVKAGATATMEVSEDKNAMRRMYEERSNLGKNGMQNINAKQIAELDKKIEAGVKKTEYQITNPDRSYVVVTKAEYDYFNKLKNPPAFGSSNTVFTKEMKDAAEKSFRSKMGPGKAGVDPTAMGDLIKIGGYYIEGGIRDFGKFSEKMIEDFGETIRPYIQNIWDKANEGMGTAKEEEKPQQETGKTQMENEGTPEEMSTKVQEETGTSKKPSNPKSGFSESSDEVYHTSENKYVKDEPLDLFVKENKKGKVDLKGTANDIRQKLVSYMDTQIVRMNQQVDAWKRAVKSPTERAGAFFLAAGAEGDVAKVQDFIDYLKSNPEGVRPEYAAELIPKLEAALKLSPEARKMIEEGNQYYDEAGKVAKELGTIRTIRENYQSLRLYKPETEGELTKTELTQGIKRSTAHSKQRVYDNVFDAIKDGKELASDDYASLAGVHNEELTYVNAGRRLTNEMSDADTGLGKWVRRGNEPEGWEQVGRLQKDVPIKDKDGEPVLGDDGNQLHSHSVFVAPKEVAKGLEAVSDPNYLRKVAELSKLEKFNGFIKSFNVALSFFHHFQFVKQTLSSYHGEKILSELPQMIGKMQTPEFKDNELYFTKMGGRTTMRDANMDILSDLKTVKGTLIDKVSGLPVAKQVLQLTDASNHLLFDYMQRFMKVSTFSERVADWMARNPNATDEQILEAHKGFAKAINTTFGGLNWESLGVNKTSRSVLRLGLFAPDWLMSSILHTKYAFSDGGTAGAVARANLVKGLLVGTAFTQGLNMLTNGQTTDKNKRGHQMEWQVAPGVYVNFYGGATGELVKFISNVVETGGVQGAIRYFANKGSPLVRLSAMAATGVNYAGRNIWAGKDALEKNINGLLNLAGAVAPVPFAAQASSLDYIKQPDKTIAGTIAIGTGLGRYSKGPVQNWDVSKSKELLQFKSKVGDDKFNEANDTFNQRMNDRINVLDNSDKYNALSDDDKKRMLTEEKNKIKEKIFHENNFRYHPEHKDKLPKI